MTTLFVSDLHLDASRPHITRLFVDFIRTEAFEANALYILGDLFEAWIGDDVDDEPGHEVADALAKLHAHGVPSFFMHGNRDFLLGDAWSRRARVTLLPDPTIVTVEGERVLLMHGDTLCTDDAPYQAFRSQSRSARWQRTFLARPIAERQAFARQARVESRNYTRSLDDTITDVNEKTVGTTLEAGHVKRMIHGHTHRPAVHQIDLDGVGVERIVLGDWYDQGSALRVRDGRYELSGVAAIADPANG